MKKTNVKKLIIPIIAVLMILLPLSRKAEAFNLGNFVSQIKQTFAKEEIPVLQTNSDKINSASGDQIPVKKTFYVTATAYSSTPDQTDSTPFITANGSRVHDGIIAANFLPFGTKVKIPEYSGDKIYTVEDRMHRRFSERIDLWFPTRQEAIVFGKRQVKIEVL